MTRRAFFVLGAEGSGTNLLAEALVSAGCFEDPRHRQYMDDYEFEKCPDLLMFRRSLPHRGEWPDVDEIYDQMYRANISVKMLLIFRDWYCTARSVHRRDPNRTIPKIEENMQAALDIMGKFAYMLTTYISYESFCLYPEFRRWLFVERLGLKEPTIEIKYANEKYYGD